MRTSNLRLVSCICIIASACALVACAAGAGDRTDDSSSFESATQQAGTRITIGTLATEDLLPLWVAQEEGLFESAGIDADIMQFQSATELIAGVGSGDVDVAMTDVMVAASMYAGGIDVKAEWVTLGQSADQGRFGIMVGPESMVREIADLEGTPIGVGSNTILEYVMDRLMEDAGIPEEGIVAEELQKLPVRYEAMFSGQVEAAALPATLLALGEANGCTTIVDDTQGENISQSIMISRSDFASSPDGTEAISKLKAVWDEAAALVNAHPERYRTVLVKNANLPEQIAETYPISTYPAAQLPTTEMVAPVLAWMQEKGYLTQAVSYDGETGSFSKG